MIKITQKNRERFRVWMETHSLHEPYVLQGKAYPGEEVAELMGIKWPVTDVVDADHINIDIEATDEDLGPTYESGDPEVD